MASFKDYTLPACANEGRRLPVYTPAGKVTKEWIQVRSQWADEFRAAKSQALQIVSAVQGEERAKAAKEAEFLCLSSLVCAWSFDEPCTQENVIAWLRSNPKAADKINSYAGDDEVFFGKGSDSSTTSPEPRSS